ncbi:hypothetical protein GGQ64_003981 [Rhizobium azooxidifex]|uniref:Uncharacterized protein n=1 Tax=Mycoplana azooxidifex TaxID=1636188 RepID=A0A7W6DCJ8_9HYPH|nr:hypothetical protein [Mycoplana azooxidifex]MBB3978746.1 hypothetical protein [Mycoplana azooxidifex]
MRIVTKLLLVLATVGLAALLFVAAARLSAPVEDILYGKPLRLDPDDGLALLMLAIILAPGALTAWLAELVAARRAGRVARAALVLACNGLVTGLMFGLFATLDDYFTAPGLEPAYAAIGAVAGGLCGLLQWSIAARLDAGDHC